MLSTIRMRPTQSIPILFQVGSLNGVTAITRHWENGEEADCRRCPECTAQRGVCTVLTEEQVSEEDAPTYSALDLTFVEDPVRTAAAFGRSR